MRIHTGKGCCYQLKSHESRNNKLRRPTGRRLISYDVYCSHRYFIPVLFRVRSNSERLIPDAAVKDNSGANNPPHRVGRIEISTEKSPTPIQTIEVSTRAGVSNFRNSFSVIDVNLDGYLDIAVLDEFGAKWGRQNYWLFDKRSGRYVTNSLTKELCRITHNGIVPHPETKEIEVAHFPALIPRPGKVSERYKIVNGHLVLTRKEEIRSTSKGLRVFTRKRVNGKMKTIGVKEVSEIAPQQNSSAAIQKQREARISPRLHLFCLNNRDSATRVSKRQSRGSATCLRARCFTDFTSSDLEVKPQGELNHASARIVRG